MNKYFYKIYGLKVVSELEIPEAQEYAFSEPDVTIETGSIPDFLKDSKEKGYGTWTNGTVNAWFNTPGAAQFYVEGGTRILIEPEEDGNKALMNSMILSAGMCLVLLQRNEPVLHGSAIVTGKKAAVISGESGAGKSTVTMEILKEKVGFLADDTVRIQMQDGGVYAHPTYPQQKVCRNHVEEYGLDMKNLRYIDEGRDKFALMRRECYLPDAVELGTVVVLKKKRNIDRVVVKKLVGKEALELLLDNLYLSNTYKENVGISFELLQQMICIANKAEIYEIYRPAEGNSLGQVLEEIKKILQK